VSDLAFAVLAIVLGYAGARGPGSSLAALGALAAAAATDGLAGTGLIGLPQAAAGVLVVAAGFLGAEYRLRSGLERERALRDWERGTPRHPDGW
jgi:hypothetical protein